MKLMRLTDKNTGDFVLVNPFCVTSVSVLRDITSEKETIVSIINSNGYNDCVHVEENLETVYKLWSESMNGFFNN